MNKNECEVCKSAIREKYKYHRFWKIMAIVFMCLTILFATLYFASGEIFKETINNDIEIVNEGDSNINDVTINNN